MDALRSILPGGHALRRAEGPRDGDHRRARAGQARRLRRRDRLPGYTGDLDTCIHIRTVVMKDGQPTVQAGGGTVADAQPAYEFAESQNKARPSCRRSSSTSDQPDWYRGTCLVVDNYDSFTYNLVQYLGELGAELEVVRNDVATVDELLERAPDRVVVSPGPCTPDEAGVCVEAMRRFPRRGSRRSASASATSRSPRPSAARSSGTARPRQDDDDRARRQGDLRGAARPADRRPLPLARRRRGPARLLRQDRSAAA